MTNSKQAQQMIPSRVKFPWVKMSALVFGVDVFDLDLGIQINSIEQQFKCNSVEHVSL